MTETVNLSGRDQVADLWGHVDSHTKYLAKQDGFYLLLQTGGRIILEQGQLRNAVVLDGLDDVAELGGEDDVVTLRGKDSTETLSGENE